jgi:hypothetical protein
MSTATDAPPRLFEIKGLGGAPADGSLLKVTGVKSEPVEITRTGHRIPKGATVKLTVIADVVAVGHEDVFETINGVPERVGTHRIHALKASDVQLESWTAPDDSVRFDGEKLGPFLAAAPDSVEEAAQALIDSGVSSISLTADGETRTVDFTGEDEPA